MVEMMSTERRQKDSERADLASPFFDSRMAETVRVVLPSRSLRPRTSLIRVSVMASSIFLARSVSVHRVGRLHRRHVVDGLCRFSAAQERGHTNSPGRGAKQETDPVQTPSLNRRIHLDQFDLHADQTRQIKPFPRLTRHKIHTINNRWPIITIL
jgi:hypothetical protein